MIFKEIKFKIGLKKISEYVFKNAIEVNSDEVIILLVFDFSFGGYKGRKLTSFEFQIHST